MTAMILLREWQASQVEFWKPIEESAGYDVSNLGRVRSHRSQFGKKAGKPQILTQTLSRAGYPIVQMFIGKSRTYRFVHRLVAIAFIFRADGCNVVNHLTVLRTDARAPGLEWTTHAGNMQHAHDNGLFDKAKGKIAIAKAQAERWKYRTIPDVMVKAIRNMAADGVPHSKIRKWTEVSGAQVEHIIYRTRYKNVA